MSEYREPTTQEILSHIETGITATGQSDSYCVGFCNALVWLKSCITHEEPQFFEDSKVSEISTGSTTTDDCVSRKFMYELGATCIATRDKNDKLIALGTIDELPPVTPIHGTCKDCKHWDKDDKYCKHLSNEYGWFEDDDYRVDTEEDFYCADFEKRGNENEVN